MRIIFFGVDVHIFFCVIRSLTTETAYPLVRLRSDRNKRNDFREEAVEWLSRDKKRLLCWQSTGASQSKPCPHFSLRSPRLLRAVILDAKRCPFFYRTDKQLPRVFRNSSRFDLRADFFAPFAPFAPYSVFSAFQHGT